MHAYARLLLPDGVTVDLCPGDLIGRMRSAALRIEDPRVSEAHALVSLRGRDLVLLALRGVLAVDQQRLSAVPLHAGLVVQLAPDLTLTVESVSLPERLLALGGGGLRQTPLSGSVYSLLITPRPVLLPRFVAQAPAYLWSIGDGWCASIDGAVRELREGDQLTIGERTFRVEGVPLFSTSAPATQDRGLLHPPMHIVARYDSVHIHREGMPVVPLSGVPARILSELISFGQPVEWELLARQLWRKERCRRTLLRNLDVNTARLRKKLRAAGIRPDLIHSDGTGKRELILRDGDTVEDRS